MLESSEFCRERAAAERQAASAATLPFDRQRHIGSAEGWERMAQRGEKHAMRVASRLAAD